MVVSITITQHTQNTQLIWSSTPDYNSLSHRRNVASFSIFYRYFHADCSSELANCMPPSHPAASLHKTYYFFSSLFHSHCASQINASKSRVTIKNSYIWFTTHYKSRSVKALKRMRGKTFQYRVPSVMEISWIQSLYMEHYPALHQNKPVSNQHFS